MDKQTRNSAIVEAYKDGYTQTSIAKIVGLSNAMVCMVIGKFKI
jgi:predicted transcriptional regulator